MKETRWFRGVGDSLGEAYWSAGDQASNWIAEVAKTTRLTYREIRFWGSSIAIATVVHE